MEDSSTSSSSNSSGMFPLPRLTADEHWANFCSGGRRRRILRDANLAIDGLNFLSGTSRRPGGWSPSAKSLEKFASIHSEMLHRVVTCTSQWHDDRSAPSIEASLKEILKGRGGYAPASAQASLAPYEYEKVSLPGDVHDAPRLTSLLSSSDSRVLMGYQQHMLRDLAEVRRINNELGEAGLYVDPKLRGRKSSCAVLVRRLHVLGMVRYSLTRKEDVGVFFVWKKMGKYDSSWTVEEPIAGCHQVSHW